MSALLRRNMTVWLGIYIDNNSSTYDRQKQATLSALQTYGTDHVSGVIVGNEYILDNSNTSDPASATAAIAYVSANMADFRTSVNALNVRVLAPSTLLGNNFRICISLGPFGDAHSLRRRFLSGRRMQARRSQLASPRQLISSWQTSIRGSHFFTFLVTA
jgi:hypothetical protein